MTTDPPPTSQLFVHGSYARNGNRPPIGGYGVFFLCSEKVHKKSFAYEDNSILPEDNNSITHQKMELISLLRGLEFFHENEGNKFEEIGYSIDIFTESVYVINCMDKWLHRWKQTGWKTKNKRIIKYVGLIRSIVDFIDNHRIRPMYKYVRNDTGIGHIEHGKYVTKGLTMEAIHKALSSGCTIKKNNGPMFPL